MYPDSPPPRRVPAIDFLNGEVVTRGKKHGVATPVNERIVDCV